VSDRCLGTRISDLADGRLAPAQVERAFAHVARCPACRAELDAQREASGRLAGLASAAPPDPSADLLARLRAVAGPEPVVPSQAAPGVRPAGRAGLRPAARTTSLGPAARRHRRRVAIASVAGAAALAVVAVVAGGPAAVSGPSPSGPAIAPVVDALTDEHAVTADQMPLSGPRVVLAGFVSSTTAAP
jgi:hypothetical protein